MLQPKAKREEQVATLDSAQLYLQRRLKMIDYPYFQRRGYPIGSGSVESAHKQVVQRRFKQAGMRWASQNVDPLLALRDLICNKRWGKGWDNIVDYRWQQRRRILCHRKPQEQSMSSAHVTFSTLETIGLLSPAHDLDEMPSARERPKKDPEDHPWRNNKWPTRES